MVEPVSTALGILFTIARLVIEKTDRAAAAAKQSGEMTPEEEAALTEYETARKKMPHWLPEGGA